MVLFLLGCDKQIEDPLADIEKLIEDEKYEIATEKAKSRLSSKRENDLIILDKPSNQKKIVELSNDRNRIVIAHDKNLIFRDLANPFVKNLILPQTIIGLSVSTEAEHALVLFSLPNSAGCRMVLVSLIENKNSYVSNSYVPCSSRGSTSSDGHIIYYFIEDNLYMEHTSEPKTSKMILDKKNFEYPHVNIKKKYYIYPIGKTFLILVGNAGSYIMFWFDPKQNTVEKLLENVASPKIFYGNGKNLFFVSGTIGKLHWKELKFPYYGKPSLQSDIPIELSETYSWATSNPNEFIGGFKGQLFIWNTNKEKKYIPILTNAFWVVARDQILFEDNSGKLILTNTSFSEEDWKALDVYRIAKNKREN